MPIPSPARYLETYRTPAEIGRDAIAGAALAMLDLLTAKHTAFATFGELVNDTAANYRPTLYCDKGRKGEPRAELRILANAYDMAQKEKGDPRRVYRV